MLSTNLSEKILNIIYHYLSPLTLLATVAWSGVVVIVTLEILIVKYISFIISAVFLFLSLYIIWKLRTKVYRLLCIYLFPALEELFAQLKKLNVKGDVAVIVLIVFAVLTMVYTKSPDQIANAQYKTEYNSGGEQHPDLYEVSSLDEWILKHCDSETYRIREQIKWYATEQKIKPRIVFAIAWADTGCGKNMKTTNNPGNVGNNDRGDTMSFSSSFIGWTKIVDTLNNRNLRGLQYVGQMSQGGRNDMPGTKYRCSNAPAPYKCYATSEYNWNKNVMRALSSMIKFPEVAGLYTNIRIK